MLFSNSKVLYYIFQSLSEYISQNSGVRYLGLQATYMNDDKLSNFFSVFFFYFINDNIINDW